MSLITVYNGRSRTFSCSVFESDGTTPVVLQEVDTVRCKIGRADGDPILELSSDEPTANQSTITYTPLENDATVTLTAADVSLLGPGVFLGEVLVYDFDESQPKSAGDFVLSVLRSMGGDVGGDDESSSSS